MRQSFVLLAAATLAVAACSDTPSGPLSAERLAPVLSAGGAGPIQGRYIVVFTPGVASGRQLSDQLLSAFGGRADYYYESALQGFAASIPAQALNGLRQNPNVEYIEEDGIVTADGSQSPATWGLDRIDQRDRPLNNTYNYEATGAGITVYIVDTGIRAQHSEFGGRVSGGFTAISDGNGTNDCNGHGTHVAGTVGGTTYGVAKEVALVPVRVLGCGGSGTTAGVIAGVDWVTANHASLSVANMSLGGGASTSLDAAVNNAVAAGVVFAVAAGNSNRNACNYSPARAANALTIGATTSSDARASYSNYGSCLDLFAPGSSIMSAWSTSNTATNTISGTSMATPHVAGVAALYRELNPGAGAGAVGDAIKAAATTGKVTNSGSGSPNRLLYSLSGGGPSEPPPPAELTVVHIDDLASSTTTQGGKKWKATVTIRVRDANNALVSGATVTGNWSNGTSGSTSCVTGSNGTCSVSTGALTNGTSSVLWTAASIAGTNLQYNAAANLESTIVVNRP